MAWQSKVTKNWKTSPGDGFNNKNNTSFSNNLVCLWNDLSATWNDLNMVWNQKGGGNCYNKNNTNWQTK